MNKGEGRARSSDPPLPLSRSLRMPGGLPVGLYVHFPVEGDLPRVAAPVRVRDEQFIVARGVVDPKPRGSVTREGDLAPLGENTG
jgi:hypothetical protein